MNIFKKLKNELIEALGGKVKEKEKQYITPTYNGGGLDETYVFDFKNWGSSYGGHGGTFAVQTDEEKANAPVKIKAKPKDVLDKLETVPTPFDLELLDEKIGILKDKENLITQNYAKREVSGLIERLENRKVYNDHKEYFEKFQNTTDEKIDILLSKYDLLMKSSDIFVPEFPDEAIVTMKEYSEKMEAVCGKKPVFYVIADEQKFRKAYEKRDPILLVQSPFGFYWQILGAWDEEMILLGEL